MMLPMAMAVLALLEEQNGPARLGQCAGSRCGIRGKYWGAWPHWSARHPTRPLAGVASDRFGVDIGFVEWMAVGLPISMVVLLAVYGGLVVMHKLPKSNGEGNTNEVVSVEWSKLGFMSKAEKRVLALFGGTAFLWMFRRPLNGWVEPLGLQLNDTSVAVAAAILCFACPSGVIGEKGQKERLLGAEDLRRLPWEILLLFGGGLALAKGFEMAGWATILAEHAANLGWSVVAMLVLVTAMGLFATELMSNLALTLLLTPVAGALAIGMGVHPLYFAAPVALASSGAFMLPMATPPNAIVFSSGRIRMADMAKTGLILNLTTLGIILLLWWWLAPVSWS